jgi:ketosteroid isomerase-like protein
MAMSDLGGSMTAEQTIRSAVAAFVQNYNAGNIERLTEIFADDLIDMSAGGPTLGGAEAKRHFVERVAGTHEKFHPHLVIEIDEIHVADGWAYQRGSLMVTLIPKGGGETAFIRQRYLEIWRRDTEGDWKIAIEMDNSEES